MISNVSQIKERADIIEVIGNFIPLKKAGVNYIASCPFHTEKSGSFVVSPKKQIYHCFGCGVSGDVFKFLQEYKKLSFEESVIEVANLSNVAIMQDSRGKERFLYLEALEKCHKLFLESLMGEVKVVNYLKNRGLNEEDFEKYSIGYAPPSLPQNYFTLEEIEILKELGVLFSNNVFALHHRITFALRDYAHKIVGFSGRVQPYYNFKNNAKYINSKESKIFAKRHILYNLSNAKTEIQKANKVYICEGFLDVVALSKMGFKNAVATCGTAFSNESVASFNKLKNEIEFVLCFDNDKAGILANIRAYEILFKNGFYGSKIAILKNEAKDIGEVLERGQELNLKEVSGFKYYVRYYFKEAKTPKAKDEFLKSLKEKILSKNEYFAKEELIKQACEALNIPKEYFLQDKINTQTQGQKLPLMILKSILEDKDIMELCVNYLEGDEFGSLKGVFLDIIKGVQSKEVIEILLKEEIERIPYAKMKESIKALVTSYLNYEIKKANSKGDMEAIVLLTQRKIMINSLEG